MQGRGGRWKPGGTVFGQESGSCSLGGGGSQAHGAVPGGLEFSWFLKGLVCRQPLTLFSPSWTVHDRELRLNLMVACIAGLFKIILSEHTSKIAFINILYLLMKIFLF